MDFRSFHLKKLLKTYESILHLILHPRTESHFHVDFSSQTVSMYFSSMKLSNDLEDRIPTLSLNDGSDGCVILDSISRIPIFSANLYRLSEILLTSWF
jgi:hypothetical protein